MTNPKEIQLKVYKHCLLILIANPSLASMKVYHSKHKCDPPSFGAQATCQNVSVKLLVLYLEIYKPIKYFQRIQYGKPEYCALQSPPLKSKDPQ